MIKCEIEIEKTKEALIEEVERLNRVKESEQEDTPDFKDLQIVINKMGEAFQILDQLF